MGIDTASEDKATVFLKQDVIMIHIRSIIVDGDPNYNADEEFHPTCLEGQNQIVEESEAKPPGARRVRGETKQPFKKNRLRSMSETFGGPDVRTK